MSPDSHDPANGGAPLNPCGGCSGPEALAAPARGMQSSGHAPLDDILSRCEGLYFDYDHEAVAEWKRKHPTGAAVGYLPVYVPREVFHAAGVLPVGVLGAGEQLEIVHGDACFQSYICHLPRSVVELGASGRLDVLDGMVFPSTCDVIRNLSGIWQIMFPEKLTRYLDVPQTTDPRVGQKFFRQVISDLFQDLCKLTGRKPEECDISGSIRLYAENRRVIEELNALRKTSPWTVPGSEAYLVLRAAMVLPVEDHTQLVRDYMQAAQDAGRKPQDHARVSLCGVFCEQPPLGMLRTIERSGCAIVDDDAMQLLRWLPTDLEGGEDPIDALAQAWCLDISESASRFVPDGTCKGAGFVKTVQESGADGVVFAAPSFCDPALLDRPMLVDACEAAGINSTSFQYAENSGQMQPIREQTGTFADSIKLWSDE